jgi:hypothetical protein
VSLGNIEAEPERALLLTVRRYNTVQDGWRGHPAGHAEQVALTPASTRSASPLTLPAHGLAAAGQGVCLPS